MIHRMQLLLNSTKMTTKHSPSRPSKYYLVSHFIREWTNKYANPEALEKAKIQKLTEMGFTDKQAR